MKSETMIRALASQKGKDGYHAVLALERAKNFLEARAIESAFAGNEQVSESFWAAVAVMEAVIADVDDIGCLQEGG
jgi:hypothetical protein